MLIFRKGHSLRGAVNGRTRGEDKSLHSGHTRRFEQMQCASDIGVVIKLRILNRGSNAGASGQMHDHLEFLAVKQISHGRAISKIDMVNSHIFGETGDICLLDLRIVKIVEVIEDDDGVSCREQMFSEMRADETSPACNKNPHGAKLATDGHRWTQILRPPVRASIAVATRLWPVRWGFGASLTARRAVATGSAS